MRVKEFIGNTLKFSFPTLVSAIASILAISVITRLYPTEEYGVISLFYSVGTLFASIAMLGLSSASIRFFYEPLGGGSPKKLFNFAFWTGVSVTAVSAVLVFLFTRETVSGYLFGEDNTLSLLVFAFYVVASIVYKLQSNYARLSQNAALYNVQQTIYILVNKILFVLAVLISTDYFYSVFFMTAALILEVVFIGRKSYYPSFHFPERKARAQYLKFSVPILPNEIAVTLNNSAAKFLLSYFGDFSSLGIISMGTNVANTFNLISNAFGVYWSAFMYENYKKEQKLIFGVHNFCVLVSVVLLCGIMVFQDILYLLLGAGYRESQQYFMLIMLLPIQILVCETTSYGINIAQKTYISMIVSIAACAVNLGIGYFLYPMIGVMAMAAGIAASAFIQLVLRTAFGQKYYKSIERKSKTVFGITADVLLCVVNVWIYDDLLMRILTACVMILLSLIVFRKEIRSVLVSAANLMKHLSEKRRRS